MCQHLSEKKRELTVKVQEEVVGGRHRRRGRVVAASPAVGRPPPNPTELRSRDLAIRPIFVSSGNSQPDDRVCQNLTPWHHSA